MNKILFTGGGSAGHVIPNLALMEEILSADMADVCYMGTNGIEKQLVSEWKVPYFQIECPKLIRGHGWGILKRNLKIPTQFLHAVKQATEGLKIYKPDVVFSKGGYVALPVIFAATKLKIPCLTHESDFSVGLANRIIAGKCKHVFTSFPETASSVRHGKYSGAPIRRSILSASRAEAKRKFGIGFQEKTLLIFGGGSGSTAINEAIRKNIKTLTEKYVVLHVCGKNNVVDCNIKNYLQFEFISDMGAAYAAADMIVSRSGAGTVFEILALQKPTLFIPLEGQTRGDQKENAEYFLKKGLCHVLSQKDLEHLPEEIEKTFADERLKKCLKNSNVLIGNEIILREIHALLP